LIFFLNPISIIITGYHNQFDNIAILLALATVGFYNDEEQYNKKDIGFVIMFSLCLITKHILFIFPIFLLLKKGLNWRKKILYACVPPFIFLISFLPFCVGNTNALYGIINNVFLYRSHNNSPLLELFYKLVNFPSSYKIYIYAGFMIITAYLVRKHTYENQLLLYLISLVAFSSAIANQYLVIPMAALCILDIGWIRYVYMLIMGAYLMLNGSGLGILNNAPALFPGLIGKLSEYFMAGGYTLAAWILFFTLIYVLYLEKKQI
jgi:hypothetical protein